MKSLADILSEKREKSKANSRRAELIGMFVERINAGRIGTKFKPIAPRAVAIKVGHLKSFDEIQWLYDRCRESENFSRMFFGLLKVKTPLSNN